ncbi:hypothetical protein VQ643_16015, partial [Pseudomonas sp. F1_0610]|uniref:hypothetical protein n=1 Tax=Pseudomonas sp. F1_0610 TaxID=3114284 RepID=UPI0039C14C97
LDHCLDFTNDLIESYVVKIDYSSFISCDNPYGFIRNHISDNVIIFYPLTTDIMSIFLDSDYK